MEIFKDLEHKLLDPCIIEKVEEEKRKKEEERPRIELPLPEPERPQEYLPEKEDDERGVYKIEL